MPVGLGKAQCGGTVCGQSRVDFGARLPLRAAFLRDRGLSYTKEAAIAQVYAAGTAMTLATHAVQTDGSYGYPRELAVERAVREVDA